MKLLGSVIACFILLAVAPHFALAQDDVADVTSEERTLEPAELRYYLIRRSEQRDPPAAGYKLLVVLPGGDGSDEFQPFVKRICKNSLPHDFVVAELIAPKWTKDQKIVWPTANVPVTDMQATTEAFIERAVADVKKSVKIDEQAVFALGWSSGGPPIYTSLLTEKSPLTGAFVAMSVYKPNLLPPLEQAKGKSVYILHSRADRVCPFRMAQAAADELPQHGATVKFAEYDGGHGWRGDVFGEIRAGVNWLATDAAIERAPENASPGKK